MGSADIRHPVPRIRVAGGGRVCALYGSDNSVSHDGGATWTRLTNWPRFGTSSNGFVQANDSLLIRQPVHGDNYALIATDDGLYETTDSGVSFRPVGLQGFTIYNVKVASRTATGDTHVMFSYPGGIGLFHVLSFAAS